MGHVRKALLVNLKILLAYQPQHGSSGSQVGPARFGTRKELGCGSAPLSPIFLEPTPARDTPSPLSSSELAMVTSALILGPKQVPRPSQCQCRGGKTTLPLPRLLLQTQSRTRLTFPVSTGRVVDSSHSTVGAS